MSEHQNIDPDGTAPLLGLSTQEASLAAKLLSKLLNVSPRRENINCDVHAVACALYEARRDRRHFFPEDLFSDPAWDILLMLYCLEGRRQMISMTGLCAASDVPQTTALRWIKDLELFGLLMRSPHPSDHRSSYVLLTDAGREKLDACLRRIAQRRLSIVGDIASFACGKSTFDKDE